MDGLESLMVVLFLSYLALLLTAVVEWLRSRQTRYLSRWLWLPIIVIFSIVGPLAFLLLGRERRVLTAAAERWNANGEG
jgi:uncharacterized membrane protein